MMQIGRGTYRVERRHLDDPLKPYLAPIRVDLPSFHIAIEYSAEPLPILPPVLVHYPNGTGAFSRYNGGETHNAAPISKWLLGEPTQLNLRGPPSDDAKVHRKRKRVKAEKKTIVREPRRSKTSPAAAKRQRNCTNEASAMPSPTPNLSPGSPEPTVKVEPVEHEYRYFIPPPIRIYQHTTVIKEEPLP